MLREMGMVKLTATRTTGDLTVTDSVCGGEAINFYYDPATRCYISGDVYISDKSLRNARELETNLRWLDTRVLEICNCWKN